MSVLISRKHWDSLLLEIEDARRQRHLLTYRALIERLSTSGRDKTSQLYPLAIGNMMIAAMNLAVHVGEPLVTADVIRGV